MLLISLFILSQVEFSDEERSEKPVLDTMASNREAWIQELLLPLFVSSLENLSTRI